MSQTVQEHNRKWHRRSVESFVGGLSAVRSTPKPSNVERSMPLKRLSDQEFRMLAGAGYRVTSRHMKTHTVI